MRSIEANYRKIQLSNLGLGSYLCLAQSVKGRGFVRKSLVKAFKELMPENEYSNEETKELVDHLEYLTNLPVEGEIGVKNASGTAK